MLSKNKLKILFILLAFLAVVWGCADLFLSKPPTQVSHTISSNEYIKGLGNILRRGYQSTSYTINSLGLKGDELLPLVSEEIRILVLGDSVAFGVGLDQGNDWPAQLELYLRKKGVSATVLNAAQSGTTYQYALGAFKYFYERVPFDIVIVHATGNLYALSRSEKEQNINIVAAGQQLFPQYKSKNLTANPQCEEYTDSTVNKITPNWPAWLNHLSSVSPALSGTIQYLNTVLSDKTASARPKVNACHAYGGRFLEAEMLAAGRIIQYANDKQIPLILIKPSYAYGWQHKPSAAVLKKLNLPEENNPLKFKRINTDIANFFAFFEKNSTAILIDPISLNEKKKLNSISIQALYSDYTHYSAKGSELIAETIGQELIKKNILNISVVGEWRHPAELSHSAVDLQYKELPNSLNYIKSFSSAVLGLIIFSIIGKAVTGLIFRKADKYILLAPLVGCFTVLAGHLILNNVGINFDFYLYSLILISLFVVFQQAVKNKSRINANKYYLVALLLMTGVCMHQMHNSLSATPTYFSQKTFSHYIDNIKSEIAWAEYLAIPMERRPTQHGLYVNEIKDGKIRPDYLPAVITAQPSAANLAALNIAILATKVFDLSIQDAVIATHVAFFISMLMAFLAVLNYFFRKKVVLVIASTVLALISLQGIARFIPTQFLILILSSGLILMLAITSRHLRYPYLKYVLLVISGSAFYMLPWAMHVGILGAAFAIICLHTYQMSGRIKNALSMGSLVLLCLLGARVLIFNTPVSIYHVAADLHVPSTFIKNKVVAL